MNTNISVRNNQAFSKEYLSIAHMLGGSTPAMFVPERISGYTPLRLKMINFILRSLNINKISFPAQLTIAKAVGCNREAVNRAFKFFEEQGLFIVKSGKKRYRTNIYSLGAVLCNDQVRWALRYVCTGLTRAYHRIADELKNMVKNAIVEPKRTLLYKINVLKELNTTVCSYRKRKDCKDICLKQHKEDRLYSKPYLKKDKWMDKQKAMWADWSLTEEDFNKDNVTERDYYDFYKKSDAPRDEIEQKVKIQDRQHAWNKLRYPKDRLAKHSSMSFNKPEPVVREPKKYTNAEEGVRKCMLIEDLKIRLQELYKLQELVEPASKPYLKSVINKYKNLAGK